MFTDPLPARSKPAPRHYQIPIIAAFWLADSSAVRYDHREHWKDGQRWSAKCDFSHIWPRPDRSNLGAPQKGKGNQPGHEGLIDTI
jgi:hypothetical protein